MKKGSVFVQTPNEKKKHKHKAHKKITKTKKSLMRVFAKAKKRGRRRERRVGGKKEGKELQAYTMKASRGSTSDSAPPPADTTTGSFTTSSRSVAYSAMR